MREAGTRVHRLYELRVDSAVAERREEDGVFDRQTGRLTDGHTDRQTGEMLSDR